jgi:hypothetical protein
MMYFHNGKRKWAHLLAYVSGLVNQRLLLQCEYLAAENLNLTLLPSVALGRISPTRGLEIATGWECQSRQEMHFERMSCR